MANRRLSVRKIKEVLRLKHDCGISEREIARSLNLSRVPSKTIGHGLRERGWAGDARDSE